MITRFRSRSAVDRQDRCWNTSSSKVKVQARVCSGQAEQVQEQKAGAGLRCRPRLGADRQKGNRSSKKELD